MRHLLRLTVLLLCLLAPAHLLAQAGGPGPWDNDLLVYRVRDGRAERIHTFARGGVPTAARMPDGRIIVAYQYFPEGSEDAFDKVTVRFSGDEGQRWTEPRTIQLQGLPQGMRSPFDPTLVTLIDGRIRMYFTSMRGRTIEEGTPAIYSAVSGDGEHFTVEPGVRFKIDGRPVIDCAVVLHQNIFHLYVPDNGARGAPGAASPDGRAYHATSTDGLSFDRQADVQIPGQRRWLGGALTDDNLIRFFGTGGPGGMWIGYSEDGRSWRLEDNIPRVMGADPGVVALNDGAWLIVATGPPRSAGGDRGAPPPPPPPPNRGQ